MKNGLLILILIALIILAVILGNTQQLKPQQPNSLTSDDLTIENEVAQRLAQGVRIQTISSIPFAPDYLHSVHTLHELLEKSFPAVHARLGKEVINQGGLLFTWRGSNRALKPILLLSHLDVVPVEPGTESAWQYPPFAGTIADGYIWGRGTWDDKSSLFAALEAVEKLLARGFEPERTLMLAFGHDEEVGGGQGAKAIAAELARRGLVFEFILDEGAVIGKGLIPDVAASVAMIGIAEKGYLTLELSVSGSGGHSSMPPFVTVVGQLSSAIVKLEQAQMPARLNNATRQMLTVLAPQMPFLKRAVIANLWLFEPLLVRQMIQKPRTAAYLRTTIAPTVFQAGTKDNVLPQSASAKVNFRIVPGESKALVKRRVESIVDNDLIEVQEVGAAASEPSLISPTQGLAFNRIGQVINTLWPETLVAPVLLFGATDSRHYAELSGQIYRFTPIQVSAADLKRIHGTNERIAVEDYKNAIRFYYLLIKNSAGLSVDQAKIDDAA